MSGWNEDNFLEKVMPLLEKNLDAGICPDAPTLCAVADGAAPATIRQAVQAHAARCSACADLMRRMESFRQSAAVAPWREWIQAEKRLNGQMQQFLVTGDASARVVAVRRVAWWKLAWVLVPVAAAAAVILWLPKPTAPPNTAAGVKLIPHAVAVQERPTPGIPKPPPAKAPLAATAAPATAGGVSAREGNAPSPEPVETAAAPVPEPEPEPVPAAEPGQTHSPSKSFAPLIATAGGQSAPSTPPPNASPTYVRIDAGTRVWILLQSTSPQNNGGFTFKGVVLLPVTQGGSILLDRETRVVGTGKVNQGRTTIRIAEFVWQGARYKLRGTPVTLRAPEPGTGPAVEFNAGQVLETWLASMSIYERVPGGPPPQG